MAYTFEQYKESSDAIRKIIGDFVPEVLVVLGSGLGFLADDPEDSISVPYAEIPGFKVSTAPGHQGRLVFAEVEGKKVVFMQGRLHCYEGNSMEDVTYPIRVIRLLGTEKMIITNAAGCVNKDWNAGDLMLIEDQIRLFGFSPLAGPNIDEFGPRFNDMGDAYTAAFREIAVKQAKELGIELRQGVYMFFPGPQYETPAEIRAARILGADAVGMSTVPEVTVAAHCGMQVLGFTVLTNMAAGVLPVKLTGEEVLVAAAEAAEKFSKLVLACLREM